MKPRRWYSSPEANPHPSPPDVRPVISEIYLAYTARARREQGPIIKQEPAPAQATPRRAAAPRAPRRIEAA